MNRLTHLIVREKRPHLLFLRSRSGWTQKPVFYFYDWIYFRNYFWNQLRFYWPLKFVAMSLQKKEKPPLESW